jgi:hypothetical protein
VAKNSSASLRRDARQLLEFPPPIPLILAGWAFSNDFEKQQRWQETIVWAESHCCLELVRDLPLNSMYVVEKISDEENASGSEEGFSDGT